MRNLVALAIVFAVIATAPLLIASDSWLNLVIMTLYAALLGQAWNILGGYGGQFSFGHAAYFGTGAYTVAVLQIEFGVNPWIGLAVGGVAAMAVAAFIGFSTFRYGLRGSYFALVTLAFALEFEGKPVDLSLTASICHSTRIDDGDGYRTGFAFKDSSRNDRLVLEYFALKAGEDEGLA